MGVDLENGSTSSLKDGKHSNSLPPEVALALLQAGDKKTMNTVVEYVKAASRQEAPFDAPRLALTVTLQPGESGNTAFDKMDLFLANKGLTFKILREAGIDGMMNFSGNTVEYTIPLKTIEKMAGVTWEEANKHVLSILPKGTPAAERQ